MKRGDQIAYRPDHVKGHPWTQDNTEYGFVMSMSTRESGSAFCRYWIKGRPGTLRTVANSESTSLRDLVRFDSVSHDVVRDTITMIEKESERYGG